MHLNKQFITGVVSNPSFLGVDLPVETNFSVDSRTLQPGDIFIAVSGKHHDAHDFLDDVIAKGAAGFILAQSHQATIEKKYGKALHNVFVMFVQDPLQALVDLARAWRNQFSIPIVGITGSVGKTSTKEVVATVFRTAGLPYIASFGNQNTLIGLCINILKLRQEHKVAVFELGISKRSSMKEMAHLLKPTVALITHVGHAHMEGLGSLHDIAIEKRAIFSAFQPENIGIINGDLEILTKASYPHPVAKFGLKTINQIQARKINIKNNTISFVAKIYDQKYPVLLQGCHESGVMHALSALAVAYYVGIPMEIAIEAIQKQTIVEGRFQELAVGNDGIMINDAYNANPESMKSAMMAFNAYSTDREKIMVIGDMLDLGIDSAFWHRQIGRFLRKVPSIRHVILVGSKVEWTLKTLPIGIKAQRVTNMQELISLLKPLVNKNTIVLLKGSNGIHLHEVPDQFALL